MRVKPCQERPAGAELLHRQISQPPSKENTRGETFLCFIVDPYPVHRERHLRPIRSSNDWQFVAGFARCDSGDGLEQLE